MSAGDRPGRGNLIEQGLKQMVIAAIDQDDLDRRSIERLGGAEAAEPPADDNHHRQDLHFR